jgi:hypothetical protein
MDHNDNKKRGYFFFAGSLFVLLKRDRTETKLIYIHTHQELYLIYSLLIPETSCKLSSCHTVVNDGGHGQVARLSWRALWAQYQELRLVS